MRLGFHELAAHLKKSLLPVYVVTGDEPLQSGEACDRLRAAARERGFAERKILEANSSFDWQELLAESNALSLFAEQRILDLRIPSGKPGNDGAKALKTYCENPPDDILLLITLPKIEQKQTRAKWYQALEKAGAVIQIWPVTDQRLPPWIEQRMRQKGLTPEPDAIQLLADRVEGNLLAASQEIEKLLLLHGPGIISAEQLTASVADSARYDVFTLIDAALQGNTSRSLHIVQGLKNEGTAAPIVLWALSREIRQMVQITHALKDGFALGKILNDLRIWEKRKPLVTAGLKRLKPGQWQQLLSQCHQADLMIKGQAHGDCWLKLTDITAGLSGKPPLPLSA